MLEEKLAKFLSLSELKVEKSVVRSDFIELHCQRRRGKFEVCPRCASTTSRVYDHRTVRVKDEPVRSRPLILVIKKRRYYCKTCRGTFMEYIPGIWPRSRTTERLQRAISWSCRKFSNMKSVRDHFGLSSSFVYKAFYKQLELDVREYQTPWPRVIGIDEHFFTRRRGFPEYFTVFTDIGGRKLREAVLGKTHAALELGLEHIEGRRNVQWVAIDMSDTYRGFALKQFPNARIVADKFHVLRLFTNILNRYRLGVTGDKRTNPIRKLILRNRGRLKYYERNAVDRWLKDHPQVKEVYEWKEHFSRLYRMRGSRRANHRFEKLILAMRFSAIPEIKRLCRTMENWRDEVLNYFQYKLTNAMTEGFNRIASLVKNRAFGYRSARNYRLRLLTACAAY